MSRHQIRASDEAVRAWREAVGIPELNDTQVVDSALRVAADATRRELSAQAHGMLRILAWIADGHADPQALRAGDAEVAIVGSEIHARIGEARFVIAANPTAAAGMVKVASEVAGDD